MSRELTLFEAIDECWFVPACEGQRRFPPSWDPSKAINSLSEDGWQALAKLVRWRRGNSMRLYGRKKASCRNSLVSREGGVSFGDKELLISTLLLATLSEYYLDKLLLLPGKLRQASLWRAAKLVGTPQEELVSFYLNWWIQYRKKLEGGTRFER